MEINTGKVHKWLQASLHMVLMTQNSASWQTPTPSKGMLRLANVNVGQACFLNWDGANNVDGGLGGETVAECGWEKPLSVQGTCVDGGSQQPPARSSEAPR